MSEDEDPNDPQEHDAHDWQLNGSVFEGSYTCDCCGEEIVIPLDPSSGGDQHYVEDCPVCCHPHVITVTWDDEAPHVTANPEQDRY
ncbi:MAG: CPXCG motif-containing cysteine-rich protein [Planctomycetota bacterium]